MTTPNWREPGRSGFFPSRGGCGSWSTSHDRLFLMDYARHVVPRAGRTLRNRPSSEVLRSAATSPAGSRAPVPASGRALNTPGPSPTLCRRATAAPQRTVRRRRSAEGLWPITSELGARAHSGALKAADRCDGKVHIDPETFLPYVDGPVFADRAVAGGPRTGAGQADSQQLMEQLAGGQPSRMRTGRLCRSSPRSTIAWAAG